MDRTSKDTPRNILTTLTTKQPKDITVVIGTGLSAVVAPSTDALRSCRGYLSAIINAAEQLQVLHQADVCEFRNKVKKESDFLSIAHDLIRKMAPHSSDPKPPSLRECFKQFAECLERHMTSPTVVDSILSLMERGTKVITTNYYNFLEAAGQFKGKPVKSIDMQDKSEVLLWANGYTHYGVFHIHGICTDPSKIGLDPTGYEALTKNSRLMDALYNVYCSRTFLFLGCEEILYDRIFRSLFFKISSKKRALDHYMVVRKTDTDTFFKLQKDLLYLGVKLTTYGESFSHFPQYVEEMSSAICKEKVPGVVQEGASNEMSSSESEQATSPGPRKKKTRKSTALTVSRPVASKPPKSTAGVMPSRTMSVTSVSTTGEGLSATINIPPEVLALQHAQVILEMHHRGQDQFDIEVLPRSQQLLSDAPAELQSPSGIDAPLASPNDYPPDGSEHTQDLSTRQQQLALLDNSRQNVQVLQSIQHVLQAHATDSRSSMAGMNVELKMMQKNLNGLVCSSRDLVRATHGLALVNRSIVQEIVQYQQDTQCTNQRLVELIQQHQQANDIMAVNLAGGSAISATSLPLSQVALPGTNRSHRRTLNLKKQVDSPPHKRAHKRK
ncbi:protein FAM118B-like [Ambystoma mexicanum]|uniref:protein FAM118B-like n=1 Tax=Ambystoma mexicanum TaxID=8296 RepID=UPI0037E7EC85